MPNSDRRSLVRSRATRRRIAAFVLALAGAAALVPAMAAPVAASTTVPQAETEMLRLINQDRAAHGLVAYRLDARLATIARARSIDMATKNYFDHVQPDGHMVFDFISASGITWYGAGEVIAWNTWPTLFDSADAANTGWLGSPTHRAIILSADYNYIGVGLAIQSSTGKKFWTAVTIKGPDRTRGWSNMARVARSRLAPVDGKVPVWIRWEGADRRLQVLTSGLRYFQVERRVDGGSWALIRSATTSTTATLYQAPHHRYDYRVRMRDRAGNWGLWSAPFAISI